MAAVLRIVTALLTAPLGKRVLGSCVRIAHRYTEWRSQDAVPTDNYVMALRVAQDSVRLLDTCPVPARRSAVVSRVSTIQGNKD